MTDLTPGSGKHVWILHLKHLPYLIHFFIKLWWTNGDRFRCSGIMEIIYCDRYPTRCIHSITLHNNTYHIIIYTFSPYVDHNTSISVAYNRSSTSILNQSQIQTSRRRPLIQTLQQLNLKTTPITVCAEPRKSFVNRYQISAVYIC